MIREKDFNFYLQMRERYGKNMVLKKLMTLKGTVMINNY